MNYGRWPAREKARNREYLNHEQGLAARLPQQGRAANQAPAELVEQGTVMDEALEEASAGRRQY